MASTRIETPSTSDMRMNSWRLSSHIFPTRVRKSMPANHSPSVGSTSRMNPCRCLTSEVTTSRSRGSGHLLNRSVARLVMFCSVVFLMRYSAGRLSYQPRVMDNSLESQIDKIAQEIERLQTVGDPEG